MAIKSADQISIVDLTDGYSVILTSDGYTFPGSTNAANVGSCTTQILAMCGSSQVPAAVDLSAVTKPAGITVTKDNNATSPTLTITASTSFTTAGYVDIPVVVDGEITIHKKFAVSIAFKGATGAQGAQGATGSTGATGNGVSSVTITYQSSSSNTTAPTGTWQSSPPSVSAGSYLWTRMVFNYTNGTSSNPIYSVAKQGATGAQGSTGATGNGVSSVAITYQSSTSNTTAPTGTWASTPPSVSAGSYLWTRMIFTYTNGSTSDPVYSVAKQGATGATGAAGADAITIAITSSNGTIFKNSSIETTLTAHVYKAGNEVTGTALTALGTIKWYKDGGTTAVATGAMLNISAGDITNKATYTAQLEA